MTRQTVIVQRHASYSIEVLRRGFPHKFIALVANKAKQSPTSRIHCILSLLVHLQDAKQWFSCLCISIYVRYPASAENVKSYHDEPMKQRH